MSHFSEEFLSTALLVSSFRGDEVKSCQCYLLILALQGGEVHGAMLPKGLLGESKSLAGVTVGSLLSMKLLEFVRYERSPVKSSHGRRISVCRLAAGRENAARSFLKKNGFTDPETLTQTDFQLTA